MNKLIEMYYLLFKQDNVYYLDDPSNTKTLYEIAGKPRKPRRYYFYVMRGDKAALPLIESLSSGWPKGTCVNIIVEGELTVL